MESLYFTIILLLHFPSFSTVRCREKRSKYDGLFDFFFLTTQRDFSRTIIFLSLLQVYVSVIANDLKEITVITVISSFVLRLCSHNGGKARGKTTSAHISASARIYIM